MIRTLVVDDSSLFRMMLERALADCDDITVVGCAGDGEQAIAMIDRVKPDVITLDMNMPRMDGLQTLAVLSARYPQIQVVVISTKQDNDTDRVVAVLEAGAFDFVIKPTTADKTPKQTLQHELGTRLRAAAARKRSLEGKAGTSSARMMAGRVQPARPQPVRAARSFAADIVAIAASTGGPAALYDVLTVLPERIGVPVVVVQHMPPLFVESLASRLDRDVAMRCCVATDGMRLEKDVIHFAPGGYHLDVVSDAGMGLKVHIHEGPPEHHCRPAADVTFRSLAALAPATRTLAVVLTGMGCDGAAGARMLADRKGLVIAQDKESSVVWGMPGETVRLGAAHEVLPLTGIGAAIQRYMAKVVA